MGKFKNMAIEMEEAAMSVVDRRKLKREMCNQMGDWPIYIAHINGEHDAYAARPYHNHYPKGRRYKAYDVAYKMADPIGDWHGRNE